MFGSSEDKQQKQSESFLEGFFYYMMRGDYILSVKPTTRGAFLNLPRFEMFMLQETDHMGGIKGS